MVAKNPVNPLDKLNASIKKIMNKFKNSNFDLVDFAVPIIDLILPVKYSPNGRYSNRIFFTCLIDFISTHVSWRKYRGTIEYPIKGTYLNQIHNNYVKHGIYEEIRKQLLNKYLSTGRETKLKIQSVDTSFIQNKGGSVKNNNHLLNEDAKEKNNAIRISNEKIRKKIENNEDHEKIQREQTFIDFNRYNGRKKYFKIGTSNDSLGTPLGLIVMSSKQSDNTSLIETIEAIPVELNTLKNSKINRYKQSLAADSGYCSKKNRLYLIKKGYKSLILWNKRRTVNENTINKNTFNEKQEGEYKKRIKSEHQFAWFKNFPVINMNYQKTIESFTGLFSLAASIITSKRI